jgi:hypothetical protein
LEDECDRGWNKFLKILLNLPVLLYINFHPVAGIGYVVYAECFQDGSNTW